MAVTQTSLQPGTLGYFKSALATAGITKSLGAVMTERQAARFKSTLTQIVTTPSAPPAAGCFLTAIRQCTPKAGTTAQFQLMVNGWIQLAMRSGQYEWINADAVYEDEYRGCEMLSGKVRIEPVDGGYRDQGRKDRIVGFYAAFRLLSGSEKVIYWTVRQIEIHARTYSRSYGKAHPLPIPKDWKGPNLYSTGIGWDAGWYAMAVKTMLKQLLRKWGPLSTEMQEAMETDSATFGDDGEEIIGEYDEAGGLDSPALPDGASSDAQEAPQDAPETAGAETIPPSAENAPEAQEIASPSNPDDEQAAIESLFANGGL